MPLSLYPSWHPSQNASLSHISFPGPMLYALSPVPPPTLRVRSSSFYPNKVDNPLGYSYTGGSTWMAKNSYYCSWNALCPSEFHTCTDALDQNLRQKKWRFRGYTWLMYLKTSYLLHKWYPIAPLSPICRRNQEGNRQPWKFHFLPPQSVYLNQVLQIV